MEVFRTIAEFLQFHRRASFSYRYGCTQLPYSFMNDRETPSIVKVRKFMDSICSDHIGHPFDLVQGPGLERMQMWWRKGRCHLTN